MEIEFLNWIFLTVSVAIGTAAGIYIIISIDEWKNK